MRIVHVNPFFYPFRGGIEHRMHNLCRRLGEDNDVTIVTGQLPDIEEYEQGDGYDIIRLPSKFIGSYNPPYITSKRLLETLNEIDADIVEMHYRWAPSYTKDIMAYEGVKIYTCHNSFGEGEGPLQRTASYLNDRRFLSKMRRFDGVTCVSQYLLEQFAAQGIPRDMMTMISNGVEWPGSVSWKEEDFILYVGRLVRVKGLDYLIRSMNDVDTRLVICGKGPEMDKLRYMVDKYDLQEKVDLKGYVSEEERDQLLDTCKAYVMPSLYEAFGIAAAEAMSHGKPVICSDTGGLPEVVGDSGILVPPRDPKALTKAINDLLSDDEDRQRRGRLAREISKIHSWDNVKEKTMEQYRSLVRP